ncbi:MAG TPA: hypothetical protein VHZ78_01345 [Rhizomicrobium sp.]|jgi:SecD/SecF fusion protein|nr:hypothetical protein [Rhizomicrobium sp.]
MRRILIGAGIAFAALIAVGIVYAMWDQLPFGPGAHVLLEVDVPESSAPQVLDRVMEETAGVLRKRVDVASIRRVGARRLMVALTGTPDLPRLLPVFTARGAFGIYLVDDDPTRSDVKMHGVPIGETAYPSFNNPILVFNQNLLDGRHIVDAMRSFDAATGDPGLSIRWDDAGTTRFAQLTTEHLYKRLALVRDGKLLFIPLITTPLTNGTAEIHGQMTPEEAAFNARVLRGGMLPARVRVIDSGPGLPN